MRKITTAVLHSWTLNPDEYLDFADKVLSPLFLDIGFIWAYEYIAAQLILNKKNVSATNDNMARKVVQNSRNLFNEICSTYKSNQKDSIKSQMRIMALATLLISKDQAVPDKIKEIPIEQEVVECTVITLYSFRCFSILRKLESLEISSEINTNTFECIINYFKHNVNLFEHRAEFLKNIRVKLACENKQVEDALSQCKEIINFIHDGHYDDAILWSNKLSKVYPSLNELHWLQNKLYHANNASRELTIELDFVMGCSPEEDDCTVSLASNKFQDNNQIQNNNQLISLLHRAHRQIDTDLKFSTLKMLTSTLNLRTMIDDDLSVLNNLQSSYFRDYSHIDPFSMTLVKHSIEDYVGNTDRDLLDGTNSEQEQEIKEQIAIPPVVVLTGIPSPILTGQSMLHQHIKNDKIIIQNMKKIENIILESYSKMNHTFTFPDIIKKITNDQIIEMKKFYLQNLAFCDPVAKANQVLHISDNIYHKLPVITSLFDDFVVVEYLPCLKNWILNCYDYVGGYHSDYSIKSIPELINYVDDYIDIMNAWNSITPFKNIILSPLNTSDVSFEGFWFDDKTINELNQLTIKLNFYSNEQNYSTNKDILEEYMGEYSALDEKYNNYIMAASRKF